MFWRVAFECTVQYKTLFRVLLKFLGVWLMISGGTSFISTVSHVAWYLIDGSASLYLLGWLAGSLAETLAGVYLFFGGTWIVNRAIPANRPYCAECGYDLSGSVGSVPRYHAPSRRGGRRFVNRARRWVYG